MSDTWDNLPEFIFHLTYEIIFYRDRIILQLTFPSEKMAYLTLVNKEKTTEQYLLRNKKNERMRAISRLSSLRLGFYSCSNFKE